MKYTTTEQCSACGQLLYAWTNGHEFGLSCPTTGCGSMQIGEHDFLIYEREAKKRMITLLNTSILTNPGSYIMRPISLTTAKEMVNPTDYATRQKGAEVQYQSAIGHESTAAILTELLGAPVPVNRIEYRQEPEAMAIVFKLKGRPPEGKILSREELEQIGFEFFSLYRVE